ncbi:MAG: hypothetical protein HOV81_18205 [Kofleriaceae bacterium]|nr:hypothetical protein [Kofleriaceae bacterium]
MAVLVLFAAVAFSAACGPSAAEIKTAQTAKYKATAADLYGIAEQVTAETYKIGETKPPTALATVPQWYSPEGGRQSSGAGGYAQIEDRSVNLVLVVEVLELDDGSFAIKVTPKTLQHVSGSPQPRELMADDPNLPPWIHGRVESLQLAIYQRAQQFAVK